MAPASDAPGFRATLAPILLLGFVITSWGGNYVVMKHAVATNGPWTFNALRYGLAVLFLGAWLAARAGWRGLLPVPGERAAMAGVGLLQAAIMTGCTTWALTHIDASRTVLIAYSMPIWALLFAFLMSREAVTPRMAASVALGFSGLAVLFAPWGMDWTGPGARAGSAATLVGAMAWALGAVLYRRRRWTSSFGSQIFLQMLTAAGFAGLCVLLFEGQPLRLDPEFGLIVLYNALVPTILAFLAWAKILTRMPAATAGQFVLLSPIFGILLGHLVLAEPLTPTLVLSALMILGGALLAYLSQA
ncbi:DMT family transporter [uncultured Enterovirga sp.]|uniref:DMT family transporter n=1 Tax=uncultured Enterovirga sp. TaxID=2026352 RepID=UPI0035CC816F